MIIRGRHIHGMKGARRSLKRQKKYFAELGLPGVNELFDGTINIDTSPVEYEIESFDFIFRNIRHKKFPRKRVEDFGFIVIDELIHGNKRYQKWGYIYFPHKSPHFERKHVFELIGAELTGIEEHSAFEIIIKKGRLRRINP